MAGEHRHTIVQAHRGCAAGLAGGALPQPRQPVAQALALRRHRQVEPRDALLQARQQRRLAEAAQHCRSARQVVGAQAGAQAAGRLQRPRRRLACRAGAARCAGSGRCRGSQQCVSACSEGSGARQHALAVPAAAMTHLRRRPAGTRAGSPGRRPAARHPAAQQQRRRPCCCQHTASAGSSWRRQTCCSAWPGWRGSCMQGRHTAARVCGEEAHGAQQQEAVRAGFKAPCACAFLRLGACIMLTRAAVVRITA